MKKRRRHGQPHHLHLLVSLLLLPLLLDCTCAALPSSPKMARIQQHLDRANKPALRTIQHAIAYTAVGQQEVYGAKATINVWDPAIQEPNGFSLSQLWLLSGSFNGSDLNSIEAGWQVSPELYGDSRPRLFTYWTSDAYEATGCYNALCPGFVQTSSRVAIGAAISPVSSLAGEQYDMTLLIWKDPKLGNWWLSYGDAGASQLVGY
ncbi:hypothetical protein TRIUR3_19046 [Triticum urartu]|uniref:Neprosin PEP catalytic domain-containing protein n=1 Tax=Triticum urartu TaxID=4572 RepID=M7YDB7_TRIUA|nr:hypothetical protein TRIUR3_19046 [Triticum urartu]